MDDHEWLALRFEENRVHLRAVAYRILGSVADAEDAVQEAWLRLSRSDANDIENLGGWLTTVVARVSLNMLQTRKSRHEEPQGVYVPVEIEGRTDMAHPEDEALLAASRNGQFDALLALLDPEVVLRADEVAVQMGAAAEVLGASAVARTFSGRARAAQPVLVDGVAGAMWAVDGRPRVVFGFMITDGKIVGIDMISDPTILGVLDLDYPSFN